MLIWLLDSFPSLSPSRLLSRNVLITILIRILTCSTYMQFHIRLKNPVQILLSSSLWVSITTNTQRKFRPQTEKYWKHLQETSFEKFCFNCALKYLLLALKNFPWFCENESVENFTLKLEKLLAAQLLEIVYYFTKTRLRLGTFGQLLAQIIKFSVIRR